MLLFFFPSPHFNSPPIVEHCGGQVVHISVIITDKLATTALLYSSWRRCINPCRRRQPVVFFYIQWTAGCVNMTYSSVRIHDSHKSNWPRQWEALANVLLGNTWVPTLSWMFFDTCHDLTLFCWANTPLHYNSIPSFSRIMHCTGLKKWSRNAFSSRCLLGPDLMCWTNKSDPLIPHLVA